MCLQDLDEIVDSFLREVRQIDGYLPPTSVVTDDDLGATALASLELLIRLVGGLPIPERLEGISTDVGQRRARQNVPLESVLRGVRMDFRILWPAMLRRVPPEVLPGFTEEAVRIWEAVEYHVIRVHAGYLDESAVMAQERQHERGRLVGRLLSSNGEDTQLLSQTARALGVRSDSAFQVALAPADNARRFRAAAEDANALRSLHEREDLLLLIAELPRTQDLQSPRWLHDVPCIVAPIARTLAEVPRAYAIAREILAAFESGIDETVTLRGAWGRIAARRMGDVGDALAREVLDNVSANEGKRLAETLWVYFETGSVTTSAELLYCHRNTVINRLSRFHQLTGFDPNKPVDAAMIQMALQHRQNVQHDR
ncbi:helix-turn-helix domain-containing protein [Rhodococcus jostii]|uniref:Helix-turn-helix domain-containing protein n=1 Tax=Rhodococcus jostii TaxID=132919 RepID=A0ABU4CSQ3_RHOJO|nr:helix-turn-helix domain-containing protein [Rhodococcus jostii]MDV6286322.1 helix-turn-helix domain-containing protein [Rhodococcus jostii]